MLAIDTGARISLTNTGGRLELPRWSPDGKWIAFRRRTAVSSSSLRWEGKNAEILEWAQFSDYCWMPDGRRILYVSGRGARTLQTVDIQSGETQRVGELPHFQLFPFGSALAVSADGAVIATGETDPASREARIVIRRLGGNLGGAGGDPVRPGRDFHGHPVSAGRGRDWCTPERIGPDSVRLYRSSLDGSRVERLADIDYVAAFPTLSARADRLAFVRSTTDENLYKLALGAAGEAEGTPAAFAPSTTRDSSPNISCDGSRVAFASRRTGAPEIYVADAAGQNVERLTSMRATIGRQPAGFSRREVDRFRLPSSPGPVRHLRHRPPTAGFPGT